MLVRVSDFIRGVNLPAKAALRRLQAGSRERELFTAFCIVLGVVLCTGTVRLWIILQDREEIRFVESQQLAPTASSGALETVNFVASRNGKNYYYPWCSGVARLKEANKIWFSSAQAAQAAGYTLAKSCQ